MPGHENLRRDSRRHGNQPKLNSKVYFLAHLEVALCVNKSLWYELNKKDKR